MPCVALTPLASSCSGRFEDDGTRKKGANLTGDLDDKLGKGLFSNFKWGTEVEVGPPKKKAAKQAKKKIFGDGMGSDRGLGGNNAYRNTESARLGMEESQRIRAEKLAAYLDNDLEPADPLAGKIISGAALLSIFGGLIGVGFYYGFDGLLAIGAGRSG